MVAANSGTDARDTKSHEKPAIVAAASNRPSRSRNPLSIARGPTKFPKFPESCQRRITSAHMVDRRYRNNCFGFESGQSRRKNRFDVPIPAVLRER